MGILLTKAKIEKLCGRKGVNPTHLTRFLTKLSGDQEEDLIRLSSFVGTPATLKAIRAGIDEAYSNSIKKVAMN